MSRAGIYISRPGEDIKDPTLEEYEQQMMNNRRGFIEEVSDVDSAVFLDHNRTDGIPIVLIGLSDSNVVRALTPAQIDDTEFSLEGGFSDFFYRQFYNKENP